MRPHLATSILQHNSIGAVVKLAKISAKTEAFLIVVAAAWPLGWAGRVPSSLVPDFVVDKSTTSKSHISKSLTLVSMIAGDPNEKVTVT